MTAQDLLAQCRQFEREHGTLTLINVLDTIFETSESFGHSDGLDAEDVDEMVVAYFTVQ